MVNITAEVRNATSGNNGKTLKAGEINNIATILEKIADVEEKANEVFTYYMEIIFD